jgi:hypothetical protein
VWVTAESDDSADLRYAPHQPSQLLRFVDIGIGLRF